MPPKSRFPVRAHITEVRRGPITGCGATTTYGTINYDPDKIALAAAERDIQRLHDACLELQDRLDVACRRLKQSVDDASDSYFAQFAAREAGE
jgi:hypothetical protein